MEDANRQTDTFINPAIVITMAIIISVPLMKLPILIRDTASNEGRILEAKLAGPSTKIFLTITPKRIRAPRYIPFKYILEAFSFRSQH